MNAIIISNNTLVTPKSEEMTVQAEMPLHLIVKFGRFRDIVTIFIMDQHVIAQVIRVNPGRHLLVTTVGVCIQLPERFQWGMVA